MAFPLLDLIAREAIFEFLNTGVLTNTVHTDASVDLASKGESVEVIMPETPATRTVGSATTTAAANPSTAVITLDKYIETVPIKVQGDVMSKADRDVLAMYAKPIAVALVKAVEADIMAVAASLAYSVGVSGTGTVLPTTIAGFVEYKQKFDALEAPVDGRFLVCGPDLEGAYYGVFGDNSLNADVINGEMGKKLGMTLIAYPNADNDASKLIGYGWHRNAIALASRPVKPSPLAVNMATVSFGGVALSIEMWRDSLTSNDLIRGQILYGVDSVTGKGFAIFPKSS